MNEDRRQLGKNQGRERLKRWNVKKKRRSVLLYR